MSQIGTRVRQRRTELKLTQAQLAKRAGLSQVTISDIERGRNRTSRDILALADALQLGPDDLSGRHQERAPGHNIREIGKHGMGVAASGYVRVPLHEHAGKLAPHTTAGDVAAMEISERWLEANMRDLSDPKNLALLICGDDAMQPTFSRGDLLLFDYTVRDLTVDGIYMFSVNDDYYLRRLQRLPDGGVRVISDNRATYEPHVLDARARARLQIHGRVLCAWCARYL